MLKTIIPHVITGVASFAVAIAANSVINSSFNTAYQRQMAADIAKTQAAVAALTQENAGNSKAIKDAIEKIATIENQKQQQQIAAKETEKRRADAIQKDVNSFMNKIQFDNSPVQVLPSVPHGKIGH
jgi:septal ring factor EnvC (AmiA/AmiB activator)